MLSVSGNPTYTYFVAARQNDTFFSQFCMKHYNRQTSVQTNNVCSSLMVVSMSPFVSQDNSYSGDVLATRNKPTNDNATPSYRS
jgi:hypothetical protein